MIERNENEIVESTLGMKNGNELVEYYLAIENSYPDDEFDDDIFLTKFLVCGFIIIL